MTIHFSTYCQDFSYQFSDPSPFPEGVRLNWVIYSGSTCQGMKVYHGLHPDSLILDTIYGGICGNANFDQPYQYMHTKAVSGETNYYRIQFGLVTESELKSIFYLNLDSDEFRLGPNPLSDKLLIYRSPGDAPVDVSVIDEMGRVIYRELELAPSTLSIDFSLWPEGGYIVWIQREGKKLYGGRIWKSGKP